MAVYKYSVYGRGSFPLDMLRHDECWPTTTTDAFLLTSKDHRSVSLLSNTPPTYERWRSFGWVVSMDNNR